MLLARIGAWGSLPLLLFVLLPASPLLAAPPDRPLYNRDVRPILSNNCFKCHGFDAKERQAGLRLDQAEAASAALDSGARAIVPGKSDASELVRRIFAADPAERMPPAESGKSLTDAERETLRRWIDQGAEYQQHWSFLPPARSVPPAVAQSAWVRNPLDAFVLARLEAEGLAPAPEADKAALLRRLSLDLTGLPPTPQELDAFLADSDPRAYEAAVERLLANPHFGERLALDWLDAARYADTHGYHIDSGRDMTRWREWVIDAFNQNLGYDRFTVEQLAGDLLPEATLEQKIASGFNRNHMINFEGGAIPEEYHTAYIVDRVNTTGTVWLGLTVGCTQCHDHKYDPLTQRDFYRLFAFFYNVPENGLDGTKGNAAPLVRAPTESQRRRIEELGTEIAAAETRLKAPAPDVDAAQAAWEGVALAERKVAWNVLDPASIQSAGGAELKPLEDRSALASGANPDRESYSVAATVGSTGATAVRFEALPDDSLKAKGPGRSENGNFVLTEAVCQVKTQDGSQLRKFKRATAAHGQGDFKIESAIDGRDDTGWGIYPKTGEPHAAIFEFAEPLPPGATIDLAFQFHSQFGRHQAGRVRISITDAADPHAQNSVLEGVLAIAALPADKRSDSQRAEIAEYYRLNISPELKPIGENLTRLRAERDELDKRVRTTMVMEEMPKPRDAFVLVRGQYDKKGEQVEAGVPAALGALPAGAPNNRLGLASWLVDASNPLTARVAVNRYWQMLFGAGIVKTAEDFGLQGEWPSHPELLDWLACEFVQPTVDLHAGTAHGWDVKHLLRLIVCSSTYRQSSRVSPDLLARDPENRLLARGPRRRLQAEFIRDLALATSGLLNEEIGGASVSPYQPPGLWEELMSREDGANWTAQSYVQSHGPDLYRRTMYTFWKRTSPPAALATFDAPDRETCTVRRARTNTPLQALVLLNDPTYVEAARKLAERLLVEAGSTTDERLALAYKLVLSRAPRPAETAVLARLLEQQTERFQANDKAARDLLSVGESPRNEQLDAVELAAWTTLASVLLNLDEAVSQN